MTRDSEAREEIDDGDPDTLRPLEDLRSTGLLWAINKVLLHPRGFALALHYPDGTPLEEIEAHRVEPIGLSLVGDGSEPWAFAEGLDDSGFELFEAFLDQHRATQRRKP